MQVCKYNWSPIIEGIVTHQPKDGHQQEGSVLQTSNLALRLNSQNQIQVTTAMDGQLSSTYFEFGTWTQLTKLTIGGNCHRCSPTISRMVSHHPKYGH